MKKILSKLLSTLGVITANSDKELPPGLADAAPVTTPRTGNQPGDKFYMYLRHKRVKGKWTVKK